MSTESEPKSARSLKKRRSPGKAGRSGKAVKRKPMPVVFWSRNYLLLMAVEGLCLGVTALLGTVMVLGKSAGSFSGLGLFSNLLPFAAGILLWVLLAAGLLVGGLKLRHGLLSRWAVLPALLAVCLSMAAAWYTLHTDYIQILADFRGLVGGKQQATRMTLEHQVYAAYRRQELGPLQKMMALAAPFAADIQLAAQTFSVDVNLLQGVAAAESSFVPRTSHDGGKGLFQITAVPKWIIQQACEQLSVKQLDLNHPRHNAFVAAATLKYYLAEMQGDLFLGLLAYNIGPRNGGLRFIMQQYGARDFVSMQPYLQQLPRDYPIRVLSYALAFKLWQQDGRLMPYQEGNNARHIQNIGIPGLTVDF